VIGDRVSFANKLIKALVRHNVTTRVEQSCVSRKIPNSFDFYSLPL